MSELLQRIKSDQVQARKNRDKPVADALTTLLGEASPSGTESVTDEQVQKVVEKFVKNLQQMIELTTDAQKQYNMENEIALYKQYLPKQIEGFELEELVVNLITYDHCDNIGKVMKALNDNYKGQFNGKEASMIAKRLLS